MGLTIERWIAISFMIILYTDICIGQTTLLPEIVPFENEAWILICKANTFASTVSIGDPSGSTIGFCIPAAASCSANAGYALAINVTENTVTMTRTLTNNDNGTWTCSHTGGSANYVLQSPLLSRNVAQSKTDYFDKAMTASPGIEIDTTDPDYTFTFHYGCISTNLKFKWTIVPGVPWDDTSNTASTDLTCNTNQAFKSTQLTSVILPKVTQDGSKLKVSVYVDGYDNVQAVEEYTFNVTFSASSPTTQTSMEYVVGGITSTNFNVDLSSSSPINTEEVTSTSYVNVSVESPYDTNTVNTVILAYHSTDSLSMQTLSIKSISASQTIPATSVWNTSKSLRTDLYVPESSGLLVKSSLYEFFPPQSLNQTDFVSVETQSDNVLFESITTQRNILFTNTDGVPISLQATYSSKYSIKSAVGNSPLTVYPSSSLLRTDLFVQSSEVNLSVSKFEITNPDRLSTFSTYLESEFIDEIATTLITSNSYFLTDFSFSKTLVEDSFMQHNTNRQIVTTSDPFIASTSSSAVVTEEESEDSESYVSNFSSILSTYSSYQYVSDTFGRSINTNKGLSYLQESTITESFHTMINFRDNEMSTGDMETSLKITTSMSDYLVIDLQSNTHILSTERYGYFVTTIQADVKSSPLEIEVSHSNTSSNFRYSILQTSITRTFKHTSQSVVSSQINSNSVMQSYRQYESPGIELTSSYFKTSSQPTEKLQSSDTSYHIISKTPIDIISRTTQNDGHLSTVDLSISANQTGIPAEQSVASSITKKEFVTQTTGTLSQSEYIEPGASSFTYASTESLFHDSVILYSSGSDFFNLTSDIFTPSVTPVSHMSSTSVYLTSTASQNVVSEQTKDIIVISTVSSIICFSILILLISLFAKKYRQKAKHPIDTVADRIRWTNYIRSNKGTDKKAFSDSLDTGNSLIFPRLNTKLYSYPHHYEHNWEDL